MRKERPEVWNSFFFFSFSGCAFGYRKENGNVLATPQFVRDLPIWHQKTRPLCQFAPSPTSLHISLLLLALSLAVLFFYSSTRIFFIFPCLLESQPEDGWRCECSSFPRWWGNRMKTGGRRDDLSLTRRAPSCLSQARRVGCALVFPPPATACCSCCCVCGCAPVTGAPLTASSYVGGGSSSVGW